jgi:4'-phosphopantetheinyl transferase
MNSFDLQPHGAQPNTFRRSQDDRFRAEGNKPMVSVLYAHIGRKWPTRLRDRCLDEMPNTVQSKLSRYRRWKDQQAGMLGMLLLAEGLRRYGHPPELLQHLAWDARGRPFLDSRVDFNLSHSGEYVVCTLSPSVRVGIDIEKIRLIDLDHFRTQMTCEQWERTMTSENRLFMFFDLWTQKEAVVKADGRGLAIPLDGIVVTGGKAYIEDAVWEVREIKLTDGYCCHIAMNAEDAMINIEKCDASRIIPGEAGPLMPEDITLWPYAKK